MNLAGASEGIHDEEDAGITMVEVLAEEEEREQDAAAVLGAADDTECTYDFIPIKRQALYACMTCNTLESNQLAGICLACSYHCHEDHELIELYTKRNFRCDCGNSKFPHNSCKLLADKLPENPENTYNQNFKGKYCICCRPYPDPEDSVDDEMIQCCICEDWYHGRHLGSKVPDGDEYSEMICGQCLIEHPSLHYYLTLTVKPEQIDGTSSTLENGATVQNGCHNGSSPTDVPSNTVTQLSNIKQDIMKGPKFVNGVYQENLAVASISSSSDLSSTSSECTLIHLKKQDLPIGAVFFAEKWRHHLCLCAKCKEVYAKEGISYLIDQDDPVSVHEESGKRHLSQRAEPVQRELEALASLDRVTRTEMVHEYNTLSTSLREYLKKFADNKKVVRDEDIREFFSQLAANKKQRNDSGVQLFCK